MASLFPVFPYTNMAVVGTRLGWQGFSDKCFLPGNSPLGLLSEEGVLKVLQMVRGHRVLKVEEYCTGG